MNGTTIRTFLGTNSADGFFSLYPEFARTLPTYVVKGGPGCGKSGLMKKIAAESVRRNAFTEYCYCSSDAESVDAIRIPEHRICVLDGTPPHTFEPRYPGALDRTVDVGQCREDTSLAKSYPEIRAFSDEIRHSFARATDFFAAAGKIANELRAEGKRSARTDEVRTFARNFARRHLTNLRKEATVYPRFLSSLSPQGNVIFRDTVYTLCDRVFVLRDPFRISSLFLEEILEVATEYGHEIYVFYDPLCPSIPEHIAIVSANLALVTSNRFHTWEPMNGYGIRLKRFADTMPDTRKNEILLKSCVDSGLEYLKREKALHDDLEEIYIGAMNFRKLDALTAKLIKSLFPKQTGTGSKSEATTR